jgi:DNA-directed RNA polymerase specialized sigma24 family protein
MLEDISTTSCAKVTGSLREKLPPIRASPAEANSEKSPLALADALAAQEAFVVKRDAERSLQRAIDRLPDTHKNALLLTLRGGLSHTEAAEALAGRGYHGFQSNSRTF